MCPFHPPFFFLFGFMGILTHEDLLKSHGAQQPPSRRELTSGTGHGSLLTDDLDLESAAVPTPGSGQASRQPLSSGSNGP